MYYRILTNPLHHSTPLHSTTLTAQLESECIITALIYMERLVKDTRGALAISQDNYRSIIFICLVLASKGE